MYISSLIERLASDLTSSFGIRVRVEQFLQGESDTHIRIYEVQSPIQMGFVMDLEWRKVVLHSQPHYVLPNFSIYENWKRQLEINRFAFDFYKTTLEKAGFSIWFDFNHKKTEELLFPSDCYFFSVFAQSSFLEVRENMDFHYDTFFEYVRIFWGLILSFSSDLSMSDDDLPLEGKEKECISIKYERNSLYRKMCLAEYGYKCCICGDDLSSKYGEIASRFIEVHHIIPVSNYQEGIKINPFIDLIPVCPNCHSILHRRVPPYSPEELKRIIQQEEIKHNATN